MLRKVFLPSVFASWFLAGIASLLGNPIPPPQLYDGRYKVVEGSSVTIDDNMPHPPPLPVPVEGRFWVKLRKVTQDKTVYAIKSMILTSPKPSFKARATGAYFLSWKRSDAPEPPPPWGEMWLFMEVAGPDSPTASQIVLLHGGPVSVGKTLPWVVMKLEQIWPKREPGKRTYALSLIAPPWPVVQFSTEHGMTPGYGVHAGLHISDGDLVNTLGEVVKTNAELMKNFGIMPPVPDVGLDAATYGRDFEGPGAAGPVIHFSIEKDIFSEKLGMLLKNGDLLSENGLIVYKNEDLLKNFPIPPIPFGDAPVPLKDYGLDAVCYPSPFSRTVYFSTEEDVPILGLRHGDLLSSEGRVVRRNSELLKNFHPEVVGVKDFGLDAVYVLPAPYGEVWFSVETSFKDKVFGVVREGDLLSERGWIIARNRELVAPFDPLEDLADFGLDALNVSDKEPIEAYGVLTRELEGCLLLKTTEGKYYQLDNTAPFKEGETVWVKGYLGCRPIPSICQVQCIRDNAIEPAFIQVCGVLMSAPDLGKMLFHPFGIGGLYVLDNYGEFGPGDVVQVTGIVWNWREPKPGPALTARFITGIIEANEIGPCDPQILDKAKAELFIRGDANGDGQVDISDGVKILLYLFGGGKGQCGCNSCGSCDTWCANAYDVNDSEEVDLSDAIYLFQYLFAGGSPPPAPFPECGNDPTAELVYEFEPEPIIRDLLE